MSSPFDIFRRKQKMLLAIFGVAIMLAFVLEPLFRYFGVRKKVDEPVAETNARKIEPYELASLVQTRAIIVRFLEEMASAAADSLAKQGQIDPRQHLNVANLVFGNSERYLLSRFHSTPEQAAVDTMLLADKAKEIGIVVSDEAVTKILTLLSQNVVTKEQFDAIIARMNTSTRRMTYAHLYSALRTEIMAAQLQRMMELDLSTYPPAQRWDEFQQLNRQATVEVLPVAVVDLIGKVRDPSPEELRQFFDRYKGRFPNPYSPEPGFRQPQKAAFQYFKAPYEQFVKQAETQVTDEEIRKYYEQNKEEFPVTKLPAETAPTTPKPGPAAKDATEPTKTAPPPAPPAKDTTPPAKDTTPPGKSTKQGASVNPIRTTLMAGSTAARVHLASDATTKKQEPAPAASAPATPPPTPNPSASAPSGKSPASKNPDSAPATPAGKPADKPPVEEKKYEPLEKVKDVIRRKLAAKKANELIDKVFAELTVPMRSYMDDKILFDTQAKGSSVPAPRPIDWKALAKQHGVEAKETPLISAQEAQQQTDIGKTYTLVEDPRERFGLRVVTFTELAYGEKLALYKPTTLRDDEQNRYLFWKSEDVPPRVPALDEVRSEAVRAWKMIQARSLAREKAEQYAQEARAAKRPLSAVFGKTKGFEVRKAGPFTWLTMDNVSGDPSSSMPRLSEVKEVEGAGQEFMKTVFSMEPGEDKVAMNQPQTIAFVVQVQQFTPPLEQLRQDFAGEDYRKYIAVGVEDLQRVRRNWLALLEREAGFRWLRPPDQRAQ